jgi:O-antigen/teichoic acid export membrane protein
VTRRIALTFGVRLFRVALGLAASILTARALGPSGRGDYYFVVTFAGVLVQFGNLGLASSNTYLVARDPSHLRGLVANSLWVSIALGGGAGALIAVVLLGADVFPNVPSALLWLGVALAPPSLFYLLGTNLLVGVGRIVAFNLLETAANLLVLLLIGLAAILAAGVGGFAAASVIGWTVSAVVVLLALVRGRHASVRFDRAVFGAGFRFAAKAYVITLLGFLVLRGNVFLLQSSAGSTQLGYYSIAAQIADVLTIFPTTVALVLFPDLVRNVAERWSAMVATTAMVSVIVTAACVLAAMAAGPFIALLYGPSFAPATPVLLFALPGVALLSATTIVSQYLAAVGLPRALLLIWAVALALAVSLNLVLVPSFGAAGAAVALSVTYLALFVMVVWLAFQNRERRA